MRTRSLTTLALLAALGCGNGSTPPDATPSDGASGDGAAVTDGDPGDGAPADAPAPRNVLETVPAQETWEIPGLRGEAHVLRVEHGIPHVYAADRNDLARVQGFTVARDRFFFMDLLRRRAQGTLSGLLGDAALSRDIESRLTAQTFVAQQVLAQLTPEQQQYMDAFAEGVNAYIAAVRARRLPAPTEFDLAAVLFGRRAWDLMAPFERKDVAAMFASFVYELGFETDDVERGRFDGAVGASFADAPLAELRRAGARTDAFELIEPIHRASSSAGFFTETATMTGMGSRETPGETPANARPGGRRRGAPLRTVLASASANLRARGAGPAGNVGAGVGASAVNDQNAAGPRVPQEVIERLASALDDLQTRLGRVEGFGSNAWAVNRAGTPDGGSVIASDGHLQLSVPPLFYSIGLDTKLLGGGDMHVVGITLPGLPMIAVGTNGSLAWGETQLGNDITDWYREELTLDAMGYPATSLFRGERRPLTRTDERFDVADVPALMSRGRMETWARFVTFDGRWITDIEGRRVTATEALPAGQVRVPVLGGYVVPGDTNGDGKVTAISFDYAGLDGGNLIGVYDRWNRGRTVQDFREAARGLVAASQNYVASDAAGSIYYTSYQGVPCRGYLDRNPDRTWAAGADPNKLLDGTRYGGFTIPLRNGVIDEAPGATDPYRCVVPFDRTPAALDPARGYVFTANNDPGNVSTDNSLTADPYYVGGPWDSGFRAARIDQVLRETVQRRGATVESMAALQADVRSGVGEMFLPYLLDAIDTAKRAAEASPAPAAGTLEARLAAQYRARSADYDEVARRLRAWQAAGFDTPSGVETFYHSPRPQDRDSSVATTIFNTWMGRFFRAVLDDEPWPSGTFSSGGTHARLRTLRRMLEGRGAGNPRRLASFNPATNESAYFDVLSTPAVETSREVMLTSLDTALAYLRAAPTAPGEGGFGTMDYNRWLWGLRHRARLDSLIGSEIGNDPALSFLGERFNITTRQLPLAPMIPMGDPRADLRNFPRPGDQYVVDAANSGFSGERFDYGSGPTFRMVIALRGETYRGQNILPGGQSGLTNSPHFSDQLALWLGNRAVPMHLAPADVVRAATRREHFRPMGAAMR